MPSLSVLLAIIALVCFIIAALNVKTGPINATGAGLAFWVLSTLV